MNLHIDFPSRDQISRLLEHREPYSVSIYLPTDPASPGEAERIALGNLAGAAIGQLADADAPSATTGAVQELLDELALEDEFWAHQARSLAVFATPSSLVTFRLANRLSETVTVSDRFHVAPLLRAVTFPPAALVLALSQGSVRLLEIEPDEPVQPVRVPDLPSDVASASGQASIRDPAAGTRIQGAEGQKVRMRIYARQIDQALRPLLNGLDEPLILAAAEPLASIYRAANSYPRLAERWIATSPETASDAELAAEARAILDEQAQAELRALRDRFEHERAQGRATADLAEAAHAATFGLVDTLLVDIDADIPGTVDLETGAIERAEASADAHVLPDEIARRSFLTGARVLAVRSDDIPEGAPLAAILRYAPFGP